MSAPTTLRTATGVAVSRGKTHKGRQEVFLVHGLGSVLGTDPGLAAEAGAIQACTFRIAIDVRRQRDDDPAGRR
jgi:hypothetical protein